jgi:asparagine N-glycosylation enzyme membrane subunit Stt3
MLNKLIDLTRLIIGVFIFVLAIFYPRIEYLPQIIGVFMLLSAMGEYFRGKNKMIANFYIVMGIMFFLTNFLFKI